jgi:cyclic pyranopterin phosphate synthase
VSDAERTRDAGEPTLTHADARGAARMVDVGAKPATGRRATATGAIRMAPTTLALIRDNQVAKGDVLGVARIAGIMAAKRTSELVPLCHPIPLTHVDVELALDASLPGVRVTATAATVAATGVEMEALTAATIALVTIYDMAKSADRGMVIEGVRVTAKSGGRSGAFVAPPDDASA